MSRPDVFANPRIVPDLLADVVAKYATPDPSWVAMLPKPTKRENEKGKCKECGGWHGLPAVHLPYMGHAEITKALIDVDPMWSWEPQEWERGEPMIHVKGKRLVMWGRLTVLGVTRPGVGTCDDNKPEPEKELIGDFLRNAAMRFGIAVNLWSKAESADPAGSDRAGGYEPPPKSPADLLFDRVKATKGTPQADELRKLSVDNGGLSLSARAFRDDPTWAELVAAHLDAS